MYCRHREAYSRFFAGLRHAVYTLPLPVSTGVGTACIYRAFGGCLEFGRRKGGLFVVLCIV